jgi:hypothetical protein
MYKIEKKKIKGLKQNHKDYMGKKKNKENINHPWSN